MPFEPGQSGNPAGKPKGTRDHRTRVLDALASMGSSEEEYIQNLIKQATEGSSTALTLVTQRLLKETKATLPAFELPEADSPADHARNIIAAIASGDITADQGQAAMNALRGAAELTDLAEIKRDLEELKGAN